MALKCRFLLLEAPKWLLGALQAILLRDLELDFSRSQGQMKMLLPKRTPTPIYM